MMLVCVNPARGPVWVHVVWFWSCVYVFLQDMFPSYTAQINWELSEHFSSHWPLAIHLPDSFPQLSHSSSLVNIHFSSDGDAAKAGPSSWPPRWKSQTENLGVVPVCLLWTPDLHWSLSWGPSQLDQGVLASIFIPKDVLAAPEGPDHANHYKAGSVVTEPRASIGGLTANFGTIISVKGTLGLISSWSAHVLRIVWLCVDTVGRICWCYCHCLNKDKSRLSHQEIFYCIWWH